MAAPWSTIQYLPRRPLHRPPRRRLPGAAADDGVRDPDREEVGAPVAAKVRGELQIVYLSVIGLICSLQLLSEIEDGQPAAECGYQINAHTVPEPNRSDAELNSPDERKSNVTQDHQSCVSQDSKPANCRSNGRTEKKMCTCIDGLRPPDYRNCDPLQFLIPELLRQEPHAPHDESE